MTGNRHSVVSRVLFCCGRQRDSVRKSGFEGNLSGSCTCSCAGELI